MFSKKQENGEGTEGIPAPGSDFLELIYHVSREFASALDLRTVLQRVVFLSMKNVGAKSGSILVVDDLGKPVESVIITGEHVLDNTTQQLRITMDKGLAGWVARNRQPVLISNTNKDERWLRKKYASDVEASSKSAVSAPIMVRDRLVGVMTLAHETPGFFTPDHLNLVQAIADQAGIAILNARLYEESQRQARVMTALAESAAAITGSLDLEDVLLRILEQVSQAMNVQAVALALIDSKTDELVFRASIGWDRSSQTEIRLPRGSGITGWAAREGNVVIVQDPKTDPRYDPEIEHRTNLHHIKALAVAPIRSQGEIIGVLEAANPLAGYFDPEASMVMRGIGSLAGTAIRHAQLFEQLQSAHQRYRELFEDSIDPILVTNQKGKIVEANRQAILRLGYERDHLTGMDIGQIHLFDKNKIDPDFQALSNSATISYESTLKTNNGQVVPVEVYARQVTIEDSTFLQWILRDISERKSLDTLRQDLISMVYHDLQSPLANVVSSLDVVETMLPDDESIRSLIAIAIRSTQRIQRLISSLLDINRMEAGQTVMECQWVDPGNLVKEAVEIVMPFVENKKQNLKTVLPQDLPKLWIDPDMIRRVLINLLENAVKFTNQKGLIEVIVGYRQSEVEFTVKDSGQGIPENERERIFDKYTRLNPQASPKGLGLGLAYSRLAIEEHGGRIWVESEPNSGSRFIFRLPVNNKTKRSD